MDNNIARLNDLASLCAGSKTVVEVGHQLSQGLGGLSDWSPMHGCYRIQIHPAVMFHEYRSQKRRIFFHEAAHILSGHCSVGVTYDPVNDPAMLAARRQKAADWYLKREQEADRVGAKLSQMYSHVDLDAVMMGDETFDLALAAVLDSVVKAVLQYQQEQERERLEVKAWAAKQLQRAVPSRGVYALKSFAAHVASSTFSYP